MPWIVPPHFSVKGEMIPKRATWLPSSCFGPFLVMKPWHPRRILRGHESSPSVRKRNPPYATFIFLSAESGSSDDFNWPREPDALKLSTIAKASNFPLQTRKDLAKIWTKVKITIAKNFDPIQNPQRFRYRLKSQYLI
jgi:hypothetical protein